MESLHKTKLVQTSELARAELVFLHNPSTETFMSSLHPRGSLFEQATDISKAKKSHKNMIAALMAKDIKVITVESFCENMMNSKDKAEIEEFLKYIGKSLTYLCYYSQNLTEKQKHLLTDAYKLEVLRSSTPQALANILLTRPVVHLEISPKNTELQISSVQFRPLGNLVFMRDHMVVTSEGPILGRMASKQRRGEAKLIKNMFRFLHIPFHEVPNEARFELEGGDYLSSNSYEFLGVGLRTSMDSIQYLLDEKLLNKQKTVVVVVDTEDRDQQRMHLDTIFNVVDEKTVIIHEGVLGDNPKYKRSIREYAWDNDCFKEKDCEHNLEKYFKKNGFTIIPATEKEQEGYLINFLNLGTEKGIISVHRGLEEKLRGYGYKGDVVFVEYEGILAMYGAAHCSTQVFREGSVYDEHLTYRTDKKKDSDFHGE